MKMNHNQEYCFNKSTAKEKPYGFLPVQVGLYKDLTFAPTQEETALWTVPIVNQKRLPFRR